MLKTQRMGRTVAVSVTLGMSLLVAGGCKHCRHHAQPCPATCQVYSPQYGGGAVYEPPAGEYQPGQPPSVPPANDEYPMPMEEADAPAEAQSIPQRRSPIQAIKDGLRPLGSKIGKLLKRDSASDIDEDPAGTQRITSPDLGASEPQDVSPQLGAPAAGQPLSSPAFDAGYPPHAPPAADEFSAENFEQEYEFDNIEEEDDDLFGLPEENVPGDIELSPETPQQQSLPLPITEPQTDLDIYEPAESAPAPTLAPPPAEDFSPDPKYDFGDEGIEFSNEEAESRGPKLLPAPGGDARQVKFVPVERPALNVYEVGNLAICSEVRSFQDFTEIDRSGLCPGQEILIYNTLHNFVSVESPQGFRTLTRSKIEWLGHGDRVLKTVQLAEAPDASRSLRRDYFLTHHIVVPSKLSPGLYTLRVTVEDLYGHQAAHATMQVEVVK